MHSELGDVLVQATTKATGRTVNFMKVEGEQILRVRQEDYDEQGALERTTDYEPPRLRIDLSSDRAVAGASWEEMYTVVVSDATGAEVSRTPRTDKWDVVADDAQCTSPLGTFDCVHIKRDRTQGGVAQKDFFFASGVGKVKEVGGQLEELTACGAQ